MGAILRERKLRVQIVQAVQNVQTVFAGSDVLNGS
jgi:hypothetical protein